MNGITRWKLAAYLTAIFVAGGAAGALVTGTLLTRPPAPKPKVDPSVSMCRHLQHKLNLTDDQMQKVQPFADDACNRIKTINDASLRQVNQVFDARDALIAPLLTPDQQVLLTKMDQERHDSMNRHLNNPSGDTKPK
jgi:hypothetical protein